MNRRNFLKLSALGAGASLIPINSFAALPKWIQSSVNSDFIQSDKILIMLRLNGGNDGLNTVIPMSQYRNLKIHRPDIMTSSGQLLRLDNSDLRLHPVMNGIKNLFNDGKASIVQNVGIPNGSLSHFKNTDFLLTGITDQKNPLKNTGFLGRLLGVPFSDFPNNYPNEDFSSPFAINFGTTTSHTCEGIQGNFSYPTLMKSGSLNPISGGIISNNGTYNSDLLKYIENLGKQRNQYETEIQAAFDSGISVSEKYGDDRLSQAMKSIMKLSSGGLGTKIYIIDIGGFDTHHGQVESGDPRVGRHANLWSSIDTAISAFMDDAEKINDGENSYLEKVNIITVSEFGRQIGQNGSLGTDHGEAAPMFVFGKCFKKQIIGEDPEIPDQVQRGIAVPTKIDWRNYYATFSRDILGFEESTINQAFPDTQIQYLDLLGDCNQGTSLADQVFEESFKLWPIPCNTILNTHVWLQNKFVEINIYDLSGRKINFKIENTKYTFPGMNQLKIILPDIAPGVYVFSIKNGKQKIQRKFIKN